VGQARAVPRGRDGENTRRLTGPSAGGICHAGSPLRVPARHRGPVGEAHETDERVSMVGVGLAGRPACLVPARPVEAGLAAECA
jgi:hypothetical protein